MYLSFKKNDSIIYSDTEDGYSCSVENHGVQIFIIDN